jgi:tetratricopeptide (TPR) repeat protein
MVAGLWVALALAAPASEPPALEARKDALARFGAAVWNVRRDRLLTAAKQLEAIAKQDPNAAEPRRELVRVYAQLGREPDAIRIARQVLEKDPLDADTAHTLARLLFDVGDLKEAIAAAKVALAIELPIERADKTVAIARDLATLCEKANDPATAAAALGRATEVLVEARKEAIAAGAFTPVEADTLAAECFERLGKARTKLKRYEDAAAAFEAAAKLYQNPRVNDPSAAARLAWNLSAVYQARGEPALALKHLETFLRLKPTSPEPYARLAKLLQDAGRGEETVPLLRRYETADPRNRAIVATIASELARDPATRREADGMFQDLMAASNDPKLVEIVVRSYLEQSRAGQIIGMLDRAFGLLKDDRKEERPVTAVSLAARIFAAEKARVIGEYLKEDAKATAAVLRAASDDIQAGTRRTFQVYYLLGQLAARHGDLGLAALQFQEAVHRAPRETQGDAYTALIDVLHRGGKMEQLARVCRSGLETAHDVAPVYFNYHLARAMAELGDEKGALAAADKAIAQTGDSDRLTVRLQKMYVHNLLGKWDEAIALGRKLFDEFDSPADRQRVRYMLAGAYWGAKKHAEAEAELRAMLDVDPDHAGACNDLGFHLADQGRNFDEAEQLIRNAIAQDRMDRKKAGLPDFDNATYLDSLGWVLFRRGKLLEARVELERAAAIPAGAADPVIWDHLGDVHFRLGEKGKAKAAWQKAESIYETELRGSSRGRRDGRLEELKRKLKLVP